MLLRRAARARATAHLAAQMVLGGIQRTGTGTILQSVGVLLVGSGLMLPWVGLNLGDTIHATSLPIVSAGLSSPEWLSYGLMCIAVTILAVGALVVRGRSGAIVAALAGLAICLLPVLFLVQSEVADYAFQLRIANDHTAFSTITRLSGSAIPRGVPRVTLVVPIAGEWSTLMGTFRPGWWLTILGGLALLAGGWRRLCAAAHRAPRRWTLISAAIAIAAGLYVGRGLVANAVVTAASGSVRDGDYRAALSQLDVASALNDQIRYTSLYDLTLGRALERSGNPGSPTALYVHARDLGALRQFDQSLELLRRAHEAAPDDPVIRTAYDAALRSDALLHGDPTTLISALPTLGLGSPGDNFTVGIVLRRAGNYGPAIRYFRTVLQTVGDADVRSAAYTQIALAEQRLGMTAQARTDLITALALDIHDYNTLARASALGLYDVEGG